MPNLLIVGRSGNGKTSLIRELLRRYPRTENIDAEAVEIPVVHIEVPPRPDLGAFYDTIRTELGMIPHGGLVEMRRQNAHQLLSLVRTRALVIDEIQHILQAGPHTRRILLSAIKSLGNQVNIPIVALGTRDAIALFRSDEQVLRRFAMEELPLWKLDVNFRRLLVSFERLLPLRRPSGLADEQMATLLHAKSSGTIGRLARLLAAGATCAIESGEERITVPIVQSINLDMLPSELRLGD